MSVYETLADAIRLEVDAEPGLTLPVYDNPLDAVQVPCIMVLAGDIEPAAFGGSWVHHLRVNCITQRADIPGGLELADQLARLVWRASGSLSQASFQEARRPQIFGIASVDHIGREVRVDVTEACQ